MKDVAEKYQKGLISLAEASTFAHVSIYEMMDFLQLENVHSPIQSEKEMEEDISSTHKLVKKSI